MLGCGTGVARGRAQDVQRRSFLRQHVLEEPAEELQGDVLESERRPVGQAQQEEARLERGERRDLVAAEGRGRVSASYDRLQVGGRNVVRVARQDGEGELAVAKRAQARQFAGGEARVCFGHDQPAVGREAFEQDRREWLRLTAGETRAARADVTH
jgi:hypothetical protein